MKIKTIPVREDVHKPIKQMAFDEGLTIQQLVERILKSVLKKQKS